MGHRRDSPIRRASCPSRSKARRRRQPHAAQRVRRYRRSTTVTRKGRRRRTRSRRLQSRPPCRLPPASITRSSGALGRLTASMSARRCLSPDWPDRSPWPGLVGNVMTLQNVALTPKANVQLDGLWLRRDSPLAAHAWAATRSTSAVGPGLIRRWLSTATRRRTAPGTSAIRTMFSC